MTIDEIRALDRRYVEEVLDQGRLEVIDEICTEDYVGHVPGFPPLGRDGDKQIVGMMRSAFPDLRFTIEEQVVEGDRALHRLVGRGTHRGDFMGVPPTGRAVMATGMNINRFADGKLVESWGVIDVLGIMQQLGVVPPPG
jgi:predicted ester cyclase